MDTVSGFHWNIIAHWQERFQVKYSLGMTQHVGIQPSDAYQIFCLIRRKLKWNVSLEWIKILEYDLVIPIKYFASFDGKIAVQFSSNEATRLDTVSILHSNIVLHWQKRFEVKCFRRIKQNIWVESGDFIQTVRFFRRKDFSSVFCEWNKIFEYNPISLLKYFPPLEGKISLEFPSNETTYLDAIGLIYWNILFHSKKTEVKSSRRLKEYRWI